MTMTIQTIADNILAQLTEADDEDQIALLLGLFDDVPSTDLPIAGLVEFLLTTDTNDALWLLANGQQDNWDTTV